MYARTETRGLARLLSETWYIKVHLGQHGGWRVELLCDVAFLGPLPHNWAIRRRMISAVRVACMLGLRPKRSQRFATSL